MRRLHNSSFFGASSRVSAVAVDSPGVGEPQRRYELTGFNTVYNPSAQLPGQPAPAQLQSIPIIFHDAAASRGGLANGVTETSLLSVIADRLMSQQSTPNRCMENDVALQNVLEAIKLLETRDSTHSMAPPVPVVSDRVY